MVLPGAPSRVVAPALLLIAAFCRASADSATFLLQRTQSSQPVDTVCMVCSGTQGTGCTVATADMLYATDFASGAALQNKVCAAASFGYWDETMTLLASDEYSSPSQFQNAVFKVSIWKATDADYVTMVAMNNFNNGIYMQVEGLPAAYSGLLEPPTGIYNTLMVDSTNATNYNTNFTSASYTANFISTCNDTGFCDATSTDNQAAILYRYEANPDNVGGHYVVQYLLFYFDGFGTATVYEYDAAFYALTNSVGSDGGGGWRRLLVAGPTCTPATSKACVDKAKAAAAQVTCTYLGPKPGCAVGKPTYPGCLYSCVKK